MEDMQIHAHDAIYKRLKASPAASSYFQGTGEFTLLDGERAVLPRRDRQWKAWNESVFSLALDLGQSDSIQFISPGFLSDERNGIFIPDSIIVRISNDSINFRINKISHNDIPLRLRKSKKKPVYRFIPKAAIYRPMVAFKNETARYVILDVYGRSVPKTEQEEKPLIPWIFMDEISIYRTKP